LNDSGYNNFSPAALADSAEFRGWTPFPAPRSVLQTIIWPVSLLLWPCRRLRDSKRKQRDEARVVPTFDAWRDELESRDPPPVVIQFGPNCPPDGIPIVEAFVHWYGFRGRAVEPNHNPLVEWWQQETEVFMDMIYYQDDQVFADGPASIKNTEEIHEVEAPTIGDMASLFRQMEADCIAAFPEIAAAAAKYKLPKPPLEIAPQIEGAEEPDPQEDSEDKGNKENDIGFGPFPERNLEGGAWTIDLVVISGAARFFSFWEGRGYAISSDF
ncbi:MAG: hypothetical protein ACKVH0_20725, partial [Alphaproteobacteria bacterium]